jgi:hypothetical protein
MTHTKPRYSWVEPAMLTVILVAVGGAAGAASFTHVHDWTMQHSPAGTGDWFGWANAVISELVPIAALLVMRRRKLTGQPIAYPVCLLVAALAFSITAQLAVAKPGLSGGLVSVVPALAFAALAKLILGKGPTPEPETETPVAESAPEPVALVLDTEPIHTIPVTVDPVSEPVTVAALTTVDIEQPRQLNGTRPGALIGPVTR